MSAQNPSTPGPELHDLLPADVVAAILEVDKLAARMNDANQRFNKWGPLAENPDKAHSQAVREAVASGGSSADVLDERAEWGRLFTQAREDQQALRPLLTVAWRDLRAAIVANTAEALSAIEPTIQESAKVYAEHIAGAEQAAAEHRARLTIRQWVTTADRNGGPDSFRPSREVEVSSGKLRATPSEAFELLKADANGLATIQAAEAKQRARDEYHAGAVAKVAAAAAARDALEVATAKAHRARREATRVAELEATKAREERQIPNTPVVA